MFLKPELLIIVTDRTIPRILVDYMVYLRNRFGLTIIQQEINLLFCF